MDDFERKAQEHMLKTQAYEEIPDGHCPLTDNKCAVKKLLDYLLEKKVLTAKQYNRLFPTSKIFEIAHYHGLPKTHKVIRLFLINPSLFFSFSLVHHYDLLLHQ